MNTEKPLQDAVKHHIDEKDALDRKAQAANCAATVLADECGKLRKRFAELVDKATNQAERIRYLEGATNHATGTPLTQAQERIAELEAERDGAEKCRNLLREKLECAEARIAELEAQLQTANQHLSQSVEDCEHHRVTEALKARVEELEAQLAESRKEGSK